MSIGSVIRLRWLLSALLIAGVALFAIGIAAERNANDHHAPGATTHTEAAEGADEQAASSESTAGESSDERVLGLNLESSLLVGVGVMASLVLAGLTWRFDAWLLLVSAAVFAAVFAVVDIAELRSQIDKSRTGLAVLVGVIALVHAATALLAGQRVTSQTV